MSRRAGETALAAVTMANSPFYVMQLMIFGVQSGMSVLVAQYHGRGDQGSHQPRHGHRALLFPRRSRPARRHGILHPGADHARAHQQRRPRARRGARAMSAFRTSSPPSAACTIAAQRSTENPRLGAILLTVSGALNIFPQLGAHLRQARRAHARLRGRGRRHAHQPRVRGRGAVRGAGVSRRLPLMPRAAAPRPRDRKGLCQVRPAVVCNECLWSLAFSLYTVIMGHMGNNTPILWPTIAGNLQRMMTPASFAAGGAAAVLIGREIGRGNRDQVQRSSPVLDGLALVVGLVCMASSRSCATCCCGRTSCR